MLAEEYISVRIKELCDKHSISRYRLAQLTGMTQSALANIFNATSIPTIPTLEKICDALGITLSQFFSGDEAHPYLTDAQNELLEIWEHLDKKERDILMTFIRSLKER